MLRMSTLRAERLSRNITCRDFSKKVGICRTRLTQIELGQLPTGMEQRKRLARKFNRGVSTFFDKDGYAIMKNYELVPIEE